MLHVSLTGLVVFCDFGSRSIAVGIRPLEKHADCPIDVMYVQGF